MKNLLKISFVLLFVNLLLFANAYSETKNKDIVTEKIKTSAVCGMCKDRIEKNLKNVNGIVESNLNVDTKVLTVKFDKTLTSLAAIRTKLNSLGYDADTTKRDVRAYKKLPACCKDGKY
jgi:copper chaperone CopZ